MRLLPKWPLKPKLSALGLCLFFSFTTLSAQDLLLYTTLDSTQYLNTRRDVIHKWINLLPREIPSHALNTHILDLQDLLSQQRYVLSAEVNIRELTDHSAHLELGASELASVIPIPYVELADRNINEWWTDFGRDLSRINAGLALDILQLSGRLDPAYIELQLGFVDQLKLAYERPFFDGSDYFGYFAKIDLQWARQFAYETQSHKRAFIRLEDELHFRESDYTLGLSYRRHAWSTHRLSVNYQRTRVSDQLLSEFNPSYFTSQQSLQALIGFRYELDYDRRDLPIYPRRGMQIRGAFAQKGFGGESSFRQTSLEVKLHAAKSLTSKWLFHTETKARWSVSLDGANYYSSRALGYNRDFVRGYQRYVIDGYDWVYSKQSLRYILYDDQVGLGKVMPFTAFRSIPLTVAAGIHLDIGWSGGVPALEEDFLDHRLLWGVGFGMDLVVYKNFVFTMDLSRNHLGELGFFLGSLKDL